MQCKPVPLYYKYLCTFHFLSTYKQGFQLHRQTARQIVTQVSQTSQFMSQQKHCRKLSINMISETVRTTTEHFKFTPELVLYFPGSKYNRGTRYTIYLWVTFIETLVPEAKADRWEPWVGCKSRPCRRIIFRQTEDKVMDVLHCRPSTGKTLKA